MSDSQFPRDRSGDLPAWDDEGFDHYDLEQWIKAAGSYVRVGNQLRAQVIDEVKQESARRNAWKPVVQFASWGLSAALIWSLAVYMIFLVVPRGLTASDLFQRAEKLTESAGLSHDWALSEVFTESRHPGTIHAGKTQGAAKVDSAVPRPKGGV